MEMQAFVKKFHKMCNYYCYVTRGGCKECEFYKQHKEHIQKRWDADEDGIATGLEICGGYILDNPEKAAKTIENWVEPQQSEPTVNWISVKDKLPDDEQVILLSVKTKRYDTYLKRFVENSWIFSGSKIEDDWEIDTLEDTQYLSNVIKNNPDKTYEVTHWVPYPNDPTE